MESEREDIQWRPTHAHTQEGDETWHTLPLGGIHGKIPCILHMPNAHIKDRAQQKYKVAQITPSSLITMKPEQKQEQEPKEAEKWLTKEATKIKSSSEIVLAVAVVM